MRHSRVEQVTCDGIHPALVCARQRRSSKATPESEKKIEGHLKLPVKNNCMMHRLVYNFQHRRMCCSCFHCPT